MGKVLAEDVKQGRLRSIFRDMTSDQSYTVDHAFRLAHTNNGGMGCRVVISAAAHSRIRHARA
jgi:hypothetical protein